ncbi:PREDICTED: uncharacterized protein LOC107356592 [Paramuricea clavata]|uniref:PREDICTED: uncharacterized protein LOC107356592 n=1 Tax=Paramuricea clavata TaxID=317549 RepID=A0A7D9HUU3_PARCT|nr:PREDICTED: uncharacterized protein LOC107356592 [Paramuricea clavata]
MQETDLQTIQEILPSASASDIESALSYVNGDVAEAVQHLLPEPYLYEAGLDPDELHSGRKIVIDGLIMYQVIDKRRLELDELAKGTFYIIFLVNDNIIFTQSGNPKTKSPY